MICTYNTFQNRSAIRDIAKTYGLPEDEIAKITKHLPHHAIDQLESVINSLPEFREIRYNLPIHEEIMRLAQRIADFPRHLSIHSGGVNYCAGQNYLLYTSRGRRQRYYYLTIRYVLNRKIRFG